jgi:glycosyltransferase involved in cell wall biosynthesis
MVADSSYQTLRFMTQRAIESLVESEDIEFDIIVVDGNRNSVGFRGVKTITYDFEFNYNKCLNLGIKYTKYDLIALCNNDLLFHPGWATKIQRAMGSEYLSACPHNCLTKYCKMYHAGFKEGYTVEKEILGWCIVIRREVLNRIGSLDETCKFWYADNIYAEQIKRAGIKHILVYDSHVVHLKNKTLLKYPDKFSITVEQKKIFENWKQLT